MTVYALLGSSRQLSVGPESTTALMTATALGAARQRRSRPLRRARRRPRPHGRRASRCVGLHRQARLPRRPAVEAGARRLPRRRGGDHDRRPARASSPASESRATTRSRRSGSFLTHLGEIHGPTMLMATGVLVFLFVGSELFPRAPMPLIAHPAGARRWSRCSTSGPKGSPWSARCRPGLPTPRLPGIDLVRRHGAAAARGRRDRRRLHRQRARRAARSPPATSIAIDANQELLRARRRQRRRRA